MNVPGILHADLHLFQSMPCLLNQELSMQAPNIVDAFQRAVPPQMRQRPIGSAANKLAVSSPRGGIAPTMNQFTPVMSGRFDQGGFNQEGFGDFGDLGMGPPVLINPISTPPVNSFVKATSSDFGVAEISAKRPRNGL